MNASARSWCGFDIGAMEAEARALEELTIAADFWSDSNSARKTMRRLNGLKTDIDMWRDVETRISDSLELAEMAAEDDSFREELEAETNAVAEATDKAESALMLAGEYAESDALVSIHAAEGGTESQDWAEMLLRMYVRWATSRGFKNEILATTPGEEAGIKSVDLIIRGRHAYGLLRSERGAHRLVRISPFDGSARRHTSFANVEASPVIEDDIDIEIKEDDLRIDIYRASGAGGQHVNKTSSAVRMTHLPTGVVVACQNERSQAQNRVTALSMLRAKLLEKQLEEQEQERSRLKGEHVSAGFGGNRIRSYVLQPYQKINDHRTGHETSNITAVLDGDIDDFINAWLRHQIGAEESA